MSKLSVVVCAFAAALVAVCCVVLVHGQRPQLDKRITVTMCEDPMCRYNCRNESRMEQNQCHASRGHSQKAICAGNAPNALCVQQTLFDEHDHEPHPRHHAARGAARRVRNNNNDNDACEPQRAFATRPMQCGQCIRNTEHMHGNPELQFIKIADCDRADGRFTLHTACTESCSICNKNTTIVPKTCYAAGGDDSHGAIGTMWTAVAPCAERLLVEDFWDGNCTWPAAQQTTFTQACYSEFGDGREFSMKYTCE